MAEVLIFKQTPEHSTQFFNPADLGEGRLPGQYLDAAEVFAVKGSGGQGGKD